MPSPADGGCTFRRGARLGVDWGAARIGVAACDPGGLLAYPVETVPAQDEAAAMRRLAVLADEIGAIEVVMGLPLALNGHLEVAAQLIMAVAQRLATSLELPVRLVDERLTTAIATRHLTNIGGRKRRTIVDQAAATGILEGALLYERNTGTPPGYLIDHLPMEGDA
ncbi:MAG: Holliday junction resolvase RuvX [Propionibacteriaceae bacterium]|nr:Holliday junction resolvase RuvX [Propionibacteriaceae bacterium]